MEWIYACVSSPLLRIVCRWIILCVTFVIHTRMRISVAFNWVRIWRATWCNNLAWYYRRGSVIFGWYLEFDTSICFQSLVIPSILHPSFPAWHGPRVAVCLISGEPALGWFSKGSLESLPKSRIDELCAVTPKSNSLLLSTTRLVVVCASLTHWPLGRTVRYFALLIVGSLLLIDNV